LLLPPKALCEPRGRFCRQQSQKGRFVCECSDIDDIIAFREDGTFLVTKVADKVFMGKGIIHIDVFKRNDDRTIYNMVYREGKSGRFIKRFAVLGLPAIKIYDLTSGKPNSKVLYFSANPNGEAEIIKVFLRPKPRLKKLNFEFDFSSLAIKGRNSKGNTLTKNSISKILISEEGVSTLGARPIWFDDTVRRLNADSRGKYLGDFAGDDRILTVMKSGTYLHTGYDLALHFDEDLAEICKFEEGSILTAIYFHGAKQGYFLKRFVIEPSDKKVYFIPEDSGTRLIAFTLDENPEILVAYDEAQNKKFLDDETIEADVFVDVMGVKALGKRISKLAIQRIEFLDSEKNGDESATDEDDDSGEEGEDAKNSVAQEKNDDAEAGSKNL
jgi:topoisomerase IV subunit A